MLLKYEGKNTSSLALMESSLSSRELVEYMFKDPLDNTSIETKGFIAPVITTYKEFQETILSHRNHNGTIFVHYIALEDKETKRPWCGYCKLIVFIEIF